ncbi:MAG: NAD(P)-binding domain-containing protein [Xanthomonadales bacterium]|nr:NAD(P)-binding domain-containing protein [Xanthomonadales bacterium]
MTTNMTAATTDAAPIAILGAGNVGAALARNLRALGADVHFGVPDPAAHRDLAEHLGARVGSVAEAVAAADRVVLAVPYAAALEIAAAIDDWRGRILIDATNPLAPGLSGLSIGTTTSAAEQIAARARNARVVKCFNVTGAENMADPGALDGPVFMPVAGDDADARADVLALATRLGFDAVDAGPLRAARFTEAFAMTWIHLAFAAGQGRAWAFSRAQRRA